MGKAFNSFVYYNHGQKPWCKFAFTHAQPLQPPPPTHPINSVERVYESRTFPKFQYILYRVGDGELQEIFEKDAYGAK